MRTRYLVCSCLRGQRQSMLVVMGLVALGACTDPSPTGVPAAAAPGAPNLAVTEKLTIREQGATATIVRVDGCVVTETSIIAVERATKPAAGSGADIEVVLEASVFDVCLGQSIDRLDNVSSEVTFTATLSGATLAGSLVVRNSFGNLRSMPIALTWTGTGEITKGKTTVTFDNGSTLVVLRTKGASGPATVSGSLDGHIVPPSVGVATLFDATEGTLTITR